MTPEVFGILRRALTLARQAGYTCERERDEGRRQRLWCNPDGTYNGCDPTLPYWYGRAEDSDTATYHESFEVSADERAAFKLDYSARYCTFVDSNNFDFSRYEIDYSTCDRCDDRVLSDDIRQVNVAGGRRGRYVESSWCEDCTDRHAVAHNDELYDGELCVYVNGPDENMPVAYAEDNYYQHGDGEWYASPEEEEEDSDSEEDADDTGAIYRYGTNVLDTHNWPDEVKSDALCFGVELEVEPSEDSSEAQHELAAALGGKRGIGDSAYILAADSSLTRGIEIITVPQTLEQHHTGSRIQWHAISKALQAAKAQSGAGTENCGMHVHINRKALSALTVGKMLVFINDERTRSFLELVAQRTASRYCERKAKKVTDALRPTDEHYDALNIGTDHGTLELRIFRGNTRYTRIMKNLEFAHALCIYCRDASLQDVTKPGLFRAWINVRGAMYPHLSKYLIEHTEDA